MFNFLTVFFTTNGVFWFCTIFGGGLFFIQLLLMFIGLEADHGGSTIEAGNFGWLSKQKITGFLTMFGLTALTCKCQFFLSTFMTYIISTAVGVIAAIIIASIFRIAKSLESRGSTFDISQTIEQEGIVYQEIPKNGMGKISISIYNITYEINAVAELDEEISSFTPVRVIEIKDKNTVMVKPSHNK